MRRLVPIMAISLLLAACGGAAENPGVTVTNAIVTLPAVPERPGAGYFNLQANGENIILTGVSSSQAGSIALHETQTQDGVSRMTPIRELPLGRDKVAFAPGGRHAMLYDIAPDVAVGGRMALAFSFRGAPPVTVEAAVRAPGDVGHAH